jgi:hypothetical protein
VSYPPIPTPPTHNAVIGKFQTPGQSDVFQIVDSTGADVLHMNYDGSIEPAIFPLIFKTELDTNDLHNLSTTPVQIIPTAGPGTIIVPQYFSFQLSVVSAFSISNSGDGTTWIYWNGLGVGVAGRYACGAVSDSLAQDGIEYTSSVSQLSIDLADTEFGSVPVASIINQSLMITMDDVLSGGAGNSMLITISYVVVTV